MAPHSSVLARWAAIYGVAQSRTRLKPLSSMSGLPFPPPRDLPNPGVKPVSPVSPALQVDSLPAEPSGKPKIRSSFGF